MGRKIFLWSLIISGSLLQSFGSLSEKEANASSNLHVRKKRIIDDSHDRKEKFLHQEVPYVVLLISRDVKIPHCTGIILAPHAVLTAAHCVYSSYVTVISGTPETPTQRFHNVVHVIVHDDYHHDVLIVNDLALLVVREPFDIRVPHGLNRAISIYNGTLPPNSEGLVSGWGYTSRNQIKIPTHVRSILVPIISQNMCHRYVNEKLNFTEEHICTLYPNREKCCWFGDSGAPLVYAGHLIGVLSSVPALEKPHMADIFMNLLHPKYKSWVKSSIDHIHNNAMHLY